VGLPQLVELGQLESPILLTNTLNVWLVADALVEWIVERNRADGIDAGSINPVVGECNDGYLNDIHGRHVRREHVRAALAAAAGAPRVPGTTGAAGRAQPGAPAVQEGSVGAGVGMTCYGFKGGVGT